MYSEMKTAETRFSQGMDGMARGTYRLEGAHEKLLRSSHRVAAQIHTVSRDFLSGASAGDVLGASLEGIGRSLNLSLGGLAALAIGGVAIQQIYKQVEAYRELEKSIKKVHEVAMQNGDFKTLTKLEEEAKTADEAVKKLAARVKALAELPKDVMNADPSLAYDPGRPTDAQNLQQAYGDQDKNEADRVGKLNRQTSIRAGTREGDPEYFAKAAALQIESDEKVAKSMDELAAITIALNEAFAGLSKTVSEKHAERAGMTLAELAATPEIAPMGMSYERWKAGVDARKAQSLDAQAEIARANFEPEKAHDLKNQAGAIKDSISDLKPSERMNSEFKGALQVTEEYLKKIAENVTFDRKK
jgi:hypothetical protein